MLLSPSSPNTIDCVARIFLINSFWSISAGSDGRVWNTRNAFLAWIVEDESINTASWAALGIVPDFMVSEIFWMTLVADKTCIVLQYGNSVKGYLGWQANSNSGPWFCVLEVVGCDGAHLTIYLLHTYHTLLLSTLVKRYSLRGIFKSDACTSTTYINKIKWHHVVCNLGWNTTI